MARERRASEERLPPEQAVERLQRLAVFVHEHPGAMADRLRALMDHHRVHRVEAVVALDEAWALLGADREDADRWCDEHPGVAALWPCREALERRERVRVVLPADPASDRGQS